MTLYRLLRTCIAIAAITIASTALATRIHHHKINNTELASNVVFTKLAHIKHTTSQNHTVSVFMTIVNTGRKEHRIIAVLSPAAEQTRLQIARHHSNTHPQSIKEIRIKPDTESTLKPGGTHIILTGLKEKLIKGRRIPIALIFNDGSWSTLFVNIV